MNDNKCEYMLELGLCEDMKPNFMKFYDYVFNNIEITIEETEDNVKTLAIDFKEIKKRNQENI